MSGQRQEAMHQWIEIQTPPGPSFPCGRSACACLAAGYTATRTGRRGFPSDSDDTESRPRCSSPNLLPHRLTKRRQPPSSIQPGSAIPADRAWCCQLTPARRRIVSAVSLVGDDARQREPLSNIFQAPNKIRNQIVGVLDPLRDADQRICQAYFLTTLASNV
jgi:hypothetical protein